MKFETMWTHFLSDILGLLSSKILLPWQREVKISLYYTLFNANFKFSMWLSL